MAFFIVKLEFSDTPNLVLAKNVKGYKAGSIIPFAFKPYSYGLEIAYFETKADAANAVEEARRRYSFNGVPVILEVLPRGQDDHPRAV